MVARTCFACIASGPRRSTTLAIAIFALTKDQPPIRLHPVASIHKSWLSFVREASVLHFAACMNFEKEAPGELNRFNIGGVIHHLPDSVLLGCSWGESMF